MKLHETLSAASGRGVFRAALDLAMNLSGNGQSVPVVVQVNATPEVPQPMREAAGLTVDADDSGWRRLTGRNDKDLDQVTHDRASQLAQHLWQSNPLANRLIELPLAYLLGKGVRLKVEDDAAQTVLDRHWRDPINAWPIKLVKRARELSLFGEQCWPTFVGGNGFVRVGYLDPTMIGTVVMDPDNAEQPIGVVTKKDKHGDSRRYRVIINGPESVFTERTQQIRKTFSTGECFYFRVNDLCNGTRGRSDLLPNLDWLDAYDEFMFGEIDRADFMRAFMWDVELTGADETTVQAKARTITAPKAGSTRVHNENEKWTAVAPELQAADASQAARLFRNHVLGGLTVPEHWFGGGGDVNRSTGQSMAEPTEKVFEARQAYLGHMLVEVATYVLRADWGQLDAGAEMDEAQQAVLDSLRVEWPEMTAKDTTRYASAMQQCVAAVTGMLDEQLITRSTALAIIAQMAVQLGVEIDPDDELERAEQEAADRGEDRTLDGFDVTDPALSTPPLPGEQDAPPQD